MSRERVLIPKFKYDKLIEQKRNIDGDAYSVKNQSNELSENVGHNQGDETPDEKEYKENKTYPSVKPSEFEREYNESKTYLTMKPSEFLKIKSKTNIKTGNKSAERSTNKKKWLTFKI